MAHSTIATLARPILATWRNWATKRKKGQTDRQQIDQFRNSGIQSGRIFMLHLPCPRVRIYGPAFVVSTKFTMSCMVRNSSSRVCLLLGQQRQRYTSTLRALPQTVQLTRSRPWRHTPIPASVRFHGTHGHHHHGGDHGHVHADLVTTLQSSSMLGRIDLK